jgi:hypothetical protein
VPVGERLARAQIHHSLPRLDPPPQLGGVGAAQRREVEKVGASGVARAHVQVVRRVVVEDGEQPGDELVGAQGQGRVGGALVGDGGVGPGARRREVKTAGR